MKFSELPQLFRANYKVNMPWGYVPNWIEGHESYMQVDLDPVFQRSHVWNDAKRIAYVEYILSGGPSAREIQWNCYGWDQRAIVGPMLLVDGKQRMEAVRKFMNNELKAFGLYLNEYEDDQRLRSMTGPDFIFFVNNLPTYKDVLTWYLQLNAGGVVHTDEEIEKVRTLLELCEPQEEQEAEK